MGTSLTWLAGQERGKKLALRWGWITKKTPRAKCHAIDFHHKKEMTCRRAQEHIDACHAEIERLNGAIPAWE